MIEVWKDIRDYEGRYQVSNYGRIKSLPKVIKTGTGVYTKKENSQLKYQLKEESKTAHMLVTKIRRIEGEKAANY